jgi:hypothetical protein
MLRRIGFLASFVLIMIPLLVLAVGTVMVAFGAWLRDGEEHDEILLNPVLAAVADFPFKVLGRSPFE